MESGRDANEKLMARLCLNGTSGVGSSDSDNKLLKRPSRTVYIEKVIRARVRRALDTGNHRFDD